MTEQKKPEISPELELRSVDGLRQTHLVHFRTPPPDKMLYYSFERKEYVRCTVYESLPYGLLMLVEGHKTFEELKKVKETDLVFVAPPDSYRIHEEGSYFLGGDLHADMERERSWRRNLLQKGAKLDIYSKTKQRWLKAKVDAHKTDVVPGVLRIAPGRGTGVYGYYHADSTLLYPSGSHTAPVSEEELKQEQQSDDQSKKLSIDYFAQVRTIRGRMRGVCHPTTDGITAYYAPDVYPTLRVVEHKEGAAPDYSQESRPDVVLVPTTVTTFSQSKHSDRPEKIHHRIGAGDGACNFKISGVRPTDCRGVHIVAAANGLWLPVCSSRWDEKHSQFVFDDFSSSCPLFLPVSGEAILIEIETDVKPENIRCAYDVLLLNEVPKRALVTSSSWSVSEVPSVNSVLLAGHLWSPTFMLKKDEIIWKAPSAEPTEAEVETETGRVSVLQFVPL